MVACGSLPWLRSVTFDCLARRISESCPPPDSPRRCPLSPSTAFCWLRRLPVVLQGASRHDSWKIIHCYRGTTRSKGIIIVFLHLSPHLGFLTMTLMIPAWLNQKYLLFPQNPMCFIGVLHNRSMQIASNCELQWKSYEYFWSFFLNCEYLCSLETRRN